MSFTQRLVIKLLPRRWSEEIQAESEAWLLRCPECATVRSVWEIGGIRFKGVSSSRRYAVQCDSCGRVQNMPLERRE